MPRKDGRSRWIAVASSIAVLSAQGIVAAQDGGTSQAEPSDESATPGEPLGSSEGQSVSPDAASGSPEPEPPPSASALPSAPPPAASVPPSAPAAAAAAPAATPGAVAVPTPSWADLVDVHGFGVVWLTVPHDPATPAWAERPVDTFYVRFARLLVQARPSPDFHAFAHVALENPNPFYNFELTWRGLSFVHVTAGQMRIPFGGSITTPGPTLVMWDRPWFAYQMSKEAIRDIGVMVHSPMRTGVLDGALEYYFGMFNGAGRARANMPILNRDLQEYLFIGRLVFNAAPLLGMPANSRLALGVSYAHVVDDPAAADPMQAPVEAIHFLGGRLTPFTTQRETQLASVDLIFTAYGFRAQAELMYLASSALDESAFSRALGAYLELAYTIQMIRLQPAARFEYFDPDFDTGGRRSMVFSLGANFAIDESMQVSAFYSHLRNEQMGAEGTDNRLRIRYMIRF